MTDNLVMNKVVTLPEAKAHISALVSEVEAGAEITITRHGKPVARLVGAPSGTIRTPGDWHWPGVYNRSVFAPMTDQAMQEEGWPV
jgi:prevent-host-death family protein